MAKFPVYTWELLPKSACYWGLSENVGNTPKSNGLSSVPLFKLPVNSSLSGTTNYHNIVGESYPIKYPTSKPD
jgi:hypothetical protein